MDAPPTKKHVLHLSEMDAVQLTSSYFNYRAAMPGQCCPVGYKCTANECKPSSTKVTITSAEGTTIITNATNLSAAPATTSLVTVVAIPAIPNSPSDTGISPKHIGGIVAGVVGFLLVIALAVWIIRRQLNKVMHAVDQRLDNAAPVKDEAAEPGEGVQSGPDHHELHGHPTTTEIWDNQGSDRPNPSYRWEMGVAMMRTESLSLMPMSTYRRLAKPQHYLNRAEGHNEVHLHRVMVDMRHNLTGVAREL
ncbi:uncharacterized protein PG998_006743 [Apiospora kogelbergensis]|uniref:uncharacterized protein n=1 Tax=Apiospora kogelbergensis TaxID=1337665 RepID=UPI003130211A